MKYKSTYLAVLLLCLATITQAQESNVAMADAMRSEGKIFVVVGVVILLVVGLLGYVIYLDRKLSRIEKHNQ
jgi:heme/copper-type cytochrome/quinol oxidase subunit 2